MWSLAAGRNSLGRGSAQPNTLCAFHEPGAHMRPDAAPGRYVRAVAGFMWSLAAGRNSLGRGSAQPNTLCAFHEPGAHMRSVRALG